MFYDYVKLFFAPLVRIYFRLKVLDRGNVPSQGPVILVANHASFLDPIVLGSACPRKIHFIVLQEMYDWLSLRWFYWGMETIPVRTEEGDPRAIKKALARLRKGDVVGVFPEGERSSDGAISSAKVGAALLAAVSGAPVIPCHIRGAYESMPRGSRFPWPARVRVRFGEPLRFPNEEKRHRDRSQMQEFANGLLLAIARLREDDSSEGQSRGRGQRAASDRLSGNS